MTTITETCSCGAHFEYHGSAPQAAVASFRDAHAGCRRPTVSTFNPDFPPVATGMVVAATRAGAPLTAEEADVHPEHVWARFSKP